MRVFGKRVRRTRKGDFELRLPADERALLDAGVARVYTPKDFEVSRIMGDLVELVAEHHDVAAPAA